MPQEHFILNVRAVLLVAIASAYPVIGHAAPAARVDFAVGNVTAVGSNGQSRALGKGAQVEPGDTVNTNGGRAQLRFTDGAFVSLQPESQFRIDQYRFEGKQDGNEKGFFSLLKGGLRTITGLVGRSNKANYQVSTSVATIGIRGTEYTIQYGNSVTGTVGEGEIEVCNGAGCLSVTNGESYYVQGDQVKPVLTNKRTDLPPPEPTKPPIRIALAENVNAAGEPAPGFALTGVQGVDLVQGSLCDGFCGGFPSSVTAVFDANGTFLGYTDGQGAMHTAAGVTMYGNDGILAWGTFLDSTGSSVLTHFVAGLPVPSADLGNLSANKATATYTLIGTTPVTDQANNIIGSLNNAALTVSFGASSAVSGTATMNWTINGSPLSASLNTLSGSGSAMSMSGSCGTNCSVTANTSLFGPNAARAGMVYGIDDFSSRTGFFGIGAAAFAKK